MRRLTRVLGVIACVIGVTSYVACAAPAGPRSIRTFEPQRLADLELDMWKAYYAKENVRLFRLLVVMLREQYNYPWATAVREGVRLARAAATFGNARLNYETALPKTVLPDIEAAYRTARDWTGARYDPAAVAKAELAWWVARRIPGQDSPQQIGDLIAIEYALLYETQPETLMQSAQLRAQAAALRDAQAGAPDWNEIARLLLASYVELQAAVGRPS